MKLPQLLTELVLEMRGTEAGKGKAARYAE